MSITNFILRMSKHTAVYWGSPQEDGYGGRTYAQPVEIQCHWQQKTTFEDENKYETFYTFHFNFC